MILENAEENSPANVNLSKEKNHSYVYSVNEQIKGFRKTPESSFFPVTPGN